jgi:amino acid transporter
LCDTKLHHAPFVRACVFVHVRFLVGGTGIFVLTGQIAAQYAGPSTFLSFAAAGLAACCSGVCYAELSGRIPAAGSTYVYA